MLTPTVEHPELDSPQLDSAELESPRLASTTPVDFADTDAARGQYRQVRQDHWNHVARTCVRDRGVGKYYHRRVARILQQIIPRGQRVLELGCGRGDLLAALDPSTGIGVDFSYEMLALARMRHPDLTFIEADVHEIPDHPAFAQPFDFIVLSDLVNDLWDVQETLEKLRKYCTPRTRIVLNIFSNLWQMPLRFAERFKLKEPTLLQNWLLVNDVAALLRLAGFELIRHWEELLWPITTPLWDGLCNRYLVRLWPFRHGGMSHFIVARPAPPAEPQSLPIVSVVVPARNEAGNVEAIFARTPEMGGGTELIFVEGGSSDDTYGAIERAIAAHPERRTKLLKQTGKGKGDAVRLGFANASGEVLMILDADLTVPPEDLPRFYRAIHSGKAEFVNGVRLVYPMEGQAMQMLNLIANKCFGIAFTWLLGQSLKDTLCGTKVLRRSEYEKIVANRAYFGDFDPFGDFDLLFGAAKLNLAMLDLPVRYRQRVYGTTNIQRFRHGWLLVRMTLFAARRLKFV